MEPAEQTSFTRAVRSLTVAVWALTAITAVLVGLYLLAYFPSFSRSSGDKPLRKEVESAKLVESPSVHPGFHEMPLSKKIELASVIAIAKYEPDGDRVKCVLSEILKQAPGTSFYFKLGDEIAQCSHYPKPNESRGDGQLMFFVGSPADFRFSTSFFGDRLGGLGNMPVELLRKQIEEQSPSK